MALTTAETITLFQILDTPYATEFTTLDGMGATGHTATITSATAGQAKTMITTYLATLASDVEDELQTLLATWSGISTNTVKIEQGNVGSVGGVWFNYDQKRKSIEDRVKIIVPFYRQHEVVARYNQTNSMNVTVIR